MLRVWARQGKNTLEYQHCIQWTLKAGRQRARGEWRRTVPMERQKIWRIKGEWRWRQRSMEFKLQPWSHWVHWHLHQDPPCYFSPLFRNNTFSPFNSWDLFFLLHLPQNETILEGREGKKKEKHRKAKWIECVEFKRCLRDSFATPYVLKIPLVYCMYSYRRINKGGGREKNDMWQAIHLSCQHVILSTFKPHVTHSYSLPSEGDLGRNQLTHPDTAGE